MGELFSELNSGGLFLQKRFIQYELVSNILVL